MSRAVPSTAYALPPPLHRVLVVDTAFAQFRILFRERSTGDWMIWSAFNTEKQRNNRYIKVIRENRDIEFATQDHTSPIDAPLCQ